MKKNEFNSPLPSAVTRALAVLFFVMPQLVWAAKEKTPVVFTQKVKASDLYETLNYPARIEPSIQATVLSEADGVISEIKAPLGTQVKKKAPLVIVRNTDPVYQYSPMTITAPVAGIVSQVDVTVGSRVNRGDKILRVTDPTKVRVIVELASSDVPLLKRGDEGEMLLPTTTNPVAIKVRGISPLIDASTGTATCELELPANYRPPAPGVVAKVVFKVNRRKGYSIPDSALTYRGHDTFVRTVREGKAHLTAVRVGRRQAGTIEVTSGLEEGDQLIERTSTFVADGETVEIQTASETSDGKANKTQTN